jgi:hypothetical protein
MDQLRYVATEDIKPLLAARRETSEGEYGQAADAAKTKRIPLPSTWASARLFFTRYTL